MFSKKAVLILPVFFFLTVTVLILHHYSASQKNELLLQNLLKSKDNQISILRQRIDQLSLDKEIAGKKVKQMKKGIEKIKNENLKGRHEWIVAEKQKKKLAIEKQKEQLVIKNQKARLAVEDHKKQLTIEDITNRMQDLSSNYKTVLHVISHTHWDREWYLPFELFRRKLVDVVDDVLNVMHNSSKQPSPFRSFHMDGQVIPFLDYLQIRKEKKKELVEAIKAYNLTIGPWFTAPDEFLTSGESFIRNLQLAIIRTKEILGESVVKYMLPVGYLADSFGHISQLPQIYLGFGIDVAVFSRGLENNYPTEVFWDGADGSRIISIFLKHWYCNGGGVPNPSNPNDARRWFQQKRDHMISKGVMTKHLLLMNGCDHTAFDPYVLAGIKSGTSLKDDNPSTLVLHSELASYAHLISEEIKKNDLDMQVRSGELRTSVELLSHIYSTKTGQKRKNWECQSLLERWVEPLMSIMWAIDNAYQYDHSFIWLAWEKLLLTHAHDSIGGCSIQKVHEEVELRLDNCLAISRQLASEAMISLSKHIDLSYAIPESTFMKVKNSRSYFVGTNIINTLPFPRNHELARVQIDIPDDFPIVSSPFQLRLRALDTAELYPVWLYNAKHMWDYHLPDKGFRKPYNPTRIELLVAAPIPSFGYRTFELVVMDKPTNQDTAIKDTLWYSNRADPIFMENSFLKVDISASDGSITVKEKKSGLVITNLNTLNFWSDSGDVYNSVRGSRINDLENGDVNITDVVDISIKDDKAQMCQVRKKMGKMILSITYLLPSKTNLIQIRLSFINKQKDCVLKASFPFPCDNPAILADGQFDMIQRAIPCADCAQPSQRFVYLYDKTLKKKLGMAIHNRGIPQYEFDHTSSSLDLILMRATGVLGDWGQFPVDSAQDQHAMAFEYGISFEYDNDVFESDLLKKAQSFNTPLQALQVKNYPGKIASQSLLNTLSLPDTLLQNMENFVNNYNAQELRGRLANWGSSGPMYLRSKVDTKKSSLSLNAVSEFLAIEPADQLVLSALKKAEDRNSLIVRIYNPFQKVISGNLRVNRKVLRVSKVAYMCQVNEQRIPHKILELTSDTASNTKSLVAKIDLMVNPKKILSIELPLE